MKLATAERVTESGGVMESGAFGISVNDSAHIMQILRDQLYSDKILAVLREYSTNAWDAHKDAGKKDLPVEVTLPTFTDSTLRIRDFGPGLSKESVFEVYTQYGASTKRDSNNFVGMLGIGSKSGFAYSDSFNITSFHGGMKRTFVAALDKSEKGVINLLHEEPCDETGVLIEIAVQPNDIPEFETKSQNLFRYFNPRPKINTVIPELPPTQRELKQGVIYTGVDDRSHYSGSNGWVAVMGCIPYRINLDQLRGFEEGISQFLYNMSGALFFDIGEVQISASREELKYSNATKKVLVTKFNLLVEEFVRHTLDAVNTGNFTPWQKRVRFQDLRRMQLPIPDAFKHLTEGYIKIEGKVPKSCLILDRKDPVKSFGVEEGAQFVIKDDHRPLEGFRLGYGTILVKRAEKTIPFDQVRKDLDEMIVVLGVEGIPVHLTSQLPWAPPPRKLNSDTVDSKKHRVNTFKLDENEPVTHPLSDCWDIESREPTDQDVFVLLHRFTTELFDYNFYQLYREDKKLAEVFGKTMPVIYGYKGRKGTSPKEFKGSHYPKWRIEFFKSFLTDDVKVMLEQWHWSNVTRTHRNLNIKRTALNAIIKRFGDQHHLVQMIQKHIEGKEVVEKLEGKSKQFNSLGHLFERIQGHIPKSTAQAEFDSALKKYPLFNIEQFELSSLWGPHAGKWAHYIRLVDGKTKGKKAHASTSIHPDE